jgi:cytochrome c
VRVADAEDGSLQKRTIDPKKVAVSMQYFPEGNVVATATEKAINPFQKGSTWINESDCKACHAQNAKSIGPSFVSIARKYGPLKNNTAMVNRLASKIITGGRGVWGEANMSAHPQLTRETAAEMVRYILSLSAKKSAATPLPVNGTIRTNKTKKGAYVLTAAYTDQGGNGIGPLTGRTRVVLRSPIITANDFDDVYELRRTDLLTSVNKDAYAQLKNMDLSGVTKMVFTVATETEGTGIEVRVDAPTGPLIGKTDVPVGKWSEWQQIQVPITPPQGTHHLYVIFKNRLYVLNLLNLKSVEFK